jgi:hypothetical protein
VFACLSKSVCCWICLKHWRKFNKASFLGYCGFDS